MAILRFSLIFLLALVCDWAVSISWPPFIRQPRSALPEPSDDIQFDIPDIVVSYRNATKSVTLEAFKVKNLTDTESPKWVSIGYPEIVGAGENVNSTFLFTKEHITIQIKLLNENQKKTLFEKAKSQYPNENILEDNIIPLPLVQFACEIYFRADGQTHVIRGSAYDLRRSPLLLRFPLHQGSAKRIAFEKRLLKCGCLLLECELAATGNQEEINTLKITSEQFQQTGLSDKLLGPDTEKFLTREQLTQASQEIKLLLHIEESYEIEDESFSEEFIQKILNGSAERFQQIPIDQALSQLSKYGLSFNGRDLSPDEIKRELSNVLQVKTERNKQRIVPQRGHSESSVDNFDISASTIAVLGLFSADLDANFAISKSSEWAKKTSSLEDQMRELNQHNMSSVKWELEGSIIVPKSLNLAKVNRMTFSQQMDFTGIKKRITNAKYHRMYEVDTAHFGNTQEQSNLARVQKELMELKKNMSILLNISSKLEPRSPDVTDTDNGSPWNDTNKINCGSTVQGLINGTITSPNYPKRYPRNSLCQWLIVAPKDHYIKIKFNAFLLQQSPNCTKDYLKMEENPTDQWTPLGNPLCGYDTPNYTVSSMETVRIMFKTDQTVSYSGFSMSWAAVCGLTYSSRTGQIRSPNFPDNYGNGMSCDYIISPSGLGTFFVVLTFENFSLEKSSSGCHDYVEIIELRTGRIVGKLCGSENPAPISTNGPMKISFRTDGSVTHKGFLVSYVVLDCGGDITLDPNLEDHESTIIRPPTFPANYHDNMNCIWKITAPENMILIFKFSNMSLEVCNSCNCDNTEIRDGHSEYSPLISRNCGNVIPNKAFKSTGNRMLIRMRTDSATSAGIGFVGEVMAGEM